MWLMGGYNPVKYLSPIGEIMGGWDNGAAADQGKGGEGDYPLTGTAEKNAS